MFDDAVDHGWNVSGLHRRVGRSAGKCAKLSLTWTKRQVQLTIKIHWRHKSQTSQDPLKKDLVLVRRMHRNWLEDAIKCAGEFAELLDQPRNLDKVVEGLRNSGGAFASVIDDVVVDTTPLRELADFHHDALQELIDEHRPAFY